MKYRRANRNELVKIMLPAVIAVISFTGVLFGVIIPNYRASLLEGKEQVVREVTRAAWGLLAEMEAKERRGELTRAEAQAEAADHIRSLRYGDEGKDYLWINDMHPVMIMHPYRTDLEGKDISDFRDPNGFHLFKAFVAEVRANGEGFVRYQWQWKDDPKRIVPKLSFVKGFAPWGWVIGSGIYLEDVEADITAITRKAVILSMVAVALVSALAAFLSLQAIRASAQRRRAEEELLDHQAQLEETVAARTASLAEANRQLQVEVQERTTAEQEIRRQHTFLNSIIESLPYPFYVVNVKDYQITLSNTVATKDHRNAGPTCHALSHGRDTPCNEQDDNCPMETVRRSGKPTVVEHLHHHEGEIESYVELHAYPVFDERGEVTQMIEYAIDITARKMIEQERERLIAELKEALDRIKTLSGIVPICSFCKQIRDDQGYWQQVERYVSEHSEAQFSHSICPKCLAEHYPDFLEDEKV